MAPLIAVAIALSEGGNQTLESNEGPVHIITQPNDAIVCPTSINQNKLGPLELVNQCK